MQKEGEPLTTDVSEVGSHQSEVLSGRDFFSLISAFAPCGRNLFICSRNVIFSGLPTSD